MILGMLQLAVAQAADPKPPATATATATAPAPEIVISADRLAATERRLRECLARGCPPAEDIDASIAHARNQFVSGRLAQARETLRHARGRNKRHAAALPVAVSRLLQFDAQIALLYGLPDYARVGVIDSVTALRAGLASEDERIEEQRLVVAAAFLGEGRYLAADEIYGNIAKRASARGWRQLEARARWEGVFLYATFASVAPEYRAAADKRMRALLALASPEAKVYQNAAVVLELALATLRRDDAATARAQARVRDLRSATAMLVSAPRIDLTEHADLSTGTTFRIEDQWVDYSYRIAPDGSVRDIAEAGRGPGASGNWIALSRASLAGRSYVPLDQHADGPGLAATERFLLTVPLTTSTRSRVRKRAGQPTVTTVVLQQEEPAA